METKLMMGAVGGRSEEISEQALKTRLSMADRSDSPALHPNSFYKQQEIKRLMKRFIKEGVSKKRARELAKIWYQMSPEQRREVMGEKA